MIDDTAIIIPAYNEGPVIAGVIKAVKKEFKNVVCVNDGSKDQTAVFATEAGADTLSHLTNIGQGGALETGIKYALMNPDIKYFVTFDADGQHRLEDVKMMLAEIKKGEHDIIIGSRFITNTTKIPPLKRQVLKLAVLFTKATVGLKLTDTHNGLRVFNRKFANEVNLKNFGMAHASEFLEIIKKNKFMYKEVPITVEYTEYSKSKGQPIINAVNIVFDLMFRG